MTYPSYKILKMSAGLWQVYSLISTYEDGTADYKREPDYDKYKKLIWFKSKKAAIEWAESNV